MKRDMELVRDLLLAIEDGLTTLDYRVGLAGKDYSPEALQHHYRILREHGLIDELGSTIGSKVHIRGLSWEGHDFVDTLRDPEIWKKTKSAAATVGGVGFKALIEIGKALAKQELQKLGIPIP